MSVPFLNDLRIQLVLVLYSNYYYVLNSRFRGVNLSMTYSHDDSKWRNSDLSVRTCNKTLFNSLCPCDVIWWHRSGSTLAQVTACCLTAPSRYLNQFRPHFWGSVAFTSEKCYRVLKLLTYLISSKFKLFKLLPVFPGANEFDDSHI